MSLLPQCKLQKRIWSQKLAFQADVRKKSQLGSAHVRFSHRARLPLDDNGGKVYVNICQLKATFVLLNGFWSWRGGGDEKEITRLYRFQHEVVGEKWEIIKRASQFVDSSPATTTH